MKSMRATLLVAPAVTCSGRLLASFKVVISEGEQSLTPPLIGTAAMASTPKKTLPEAGAIKEKPEEENTATLGLLLGTTRV